MKKMTSDKLKIVASSFFETYPTEQKVLITSDGTTFFAKNVSLPNAHAASNDLEIHEYTNPAFELAEKEAATDKAVDDAIKEAAGIIDEGEKEAKRLVDEAKKEAATIIENAKDDAAVIVNEAIEQNKASVDVPVVEAPVEETPAAKKTAAKKSTNK
jgi:vacuolar-type H+-ATPase subunit H